MGTSLGEGSTLGGDEYFNNSVPWPDDTGCTHLPKYLFLKESTLVIDLTGAALCGFLEDTSSVAIEFNHRMDTSQAHAVSHQL
jgi:hypothetical protein